MGLQGLIHVSVTTETGSDAGLMSYDEKKRVIIVSTKSQTWTSTIVPVGLTTIQAMLDSVTWPAEVISVRLS